ncbi:MAG: hypothetical protein CVU46_11185 [Chloroflexi bacterium HGW-Chloroflexi-8]|nr:MAG: hypothetical protein CVU46_11185 [Chloroflexi bacterium HGW-Chloroflexi-8]
MFVPLANVPSSGFLAFYPKSDNNFYLKTAAGVEKMFVAVSEFAGNGDTLVFNGSNWINNNYIRSEVGENYNSIYLISNDIDGDFGDTEIYFSCEEGISLMTNKGKPNVHGVAIDYLGIRSSKLTGVGERYLVADSQGYIKVATTPIDNYWQLSGGFLSPISSNNHLSVNENQIEAGYLKLTSEATSYVRLMRYRLSGGVPTTLLNGDSLGSLEFYASDANGYANGAIIKAAAVGNHAEKSYPSSLEFHTCPTGGSNPEIRMTIRETGLVQINKGLTVNYAQQGSSLTVMGQSTGLSFIATSGGQVAINQNPLPSTLNVGGSLSLKSRYITAANQTLSSNEFMIYLNAGATSLYLPAANGSSDRLYFVANASASSVTLRVPSGDSLNNVLNGTFSIKGAGFTIILQGASISGAGWFAYELR